MGWAQLCGVPVLLSLTGFGPSPGLTKQPWQRQEDRGLSGLEKSSRAKGTDPVGLCGAGARLFDFQPWAGENTQAGSPSVLLADLQALEV